MWKCCEVHLVILAFPWKDNIRLKNSPHRGIFRKVMVLPLKTKRCKGKGSMFNCKTNIVHVYCNTVTRRGVTCSRNIIILLIFSTQICTNGLLYNMRSCYCIFSLISLLELNPSLLSGACCTLFSSVKCSISFLSRQFNELNCFPSGK